MGWRLELVQTGLSGEQGRLRVAELGEVNAPSHVDEVGLGLRTAQSLLGNLQQAFVAIQEAALRAKAVRMRVDDPTLRLKGYRPRSVQTLFGAVHLRVPRLTGVAPGREAPAVLAGSSRSSLEHDQLRARLGAWMSYRAAANLIAELFPLAAGRHPSTVQQHVLRQADRLARTSAQPRPEVPDAATSIDLGLDTTFIRSCAADGPRHHEVLIGVGSNDRGQEARIGGVLAAVEQPHRMIGTALRSLDRGPTTEVTAFTDGDKLLKQAGITASPILDWQHFARRVQVTKQAAQGLRARTNAEHRARPLIAPGPAADRPDPREPALDALAWSDRGSEAADGTGRAPAAALRHRPDPRADSGAGAAHAHRPRQAPGLHRWPERAPRELSRAPTGRSADRHVDHRGVGEHAGQPSHEQVAADALVRPRRACRPLHPDRQ
jgi:hypothetical protein